MEYQVKTLERRIYNTSQDQRYDHYYCYTDKNITCRVYIKSGSTKSDGQAQIYVLDKKTYEWRQVYFIPYQCMRTKEQLQYTNKSKNITEFRLDEIALMDMLEELL